MPWFDESGQFSRLKFVVLMALLLPAVWTGWLFWHGDLGLARPVYEAVHEVGRWAIRLIFAALAVTPLSRSLNWPRLALVRRMIGVAAFCYAALHVTVYAADQAFDLSRVATEIITRGRYKIGFYALLILAYLAVTSTDRMVRSLGGELWRYLHRGVYFAAAFAVVHDFMQAKLDVDEPWVMAGLYGWLMGYRVIVRCFGLRRGLPAWGVGALSIAAGVLTSIGESLYYWIEIGADPLRVLGAYLDLAMLRPGWSVFAVGLAVTVAAFCSTHLRQPLHETAMAHDR